jgi:hypothetical protein
MQAAAAARVLNAVRTPRPPRAGGGGQPMQAACAKSGMLVGRLGAAQDGTVRTHHERAGIRETKKSESDFNNTNRIDISWYPNRVE